MNDSSDSNQNVSSTGKLAKKSNFSKSQKSDLSKTKNLAFAKANSFRTNFFNLGAKESFIYL